PHFACGHNPVANRLLPYLLVTRSGELWSRPPLPADSLEDFSHPFDAGTGIFIGTVALNRDCPVPIGGMKVLQTASDVLPINAAAHRHDRAPNPGFIATHRRR